MDKNELIQTVGSMIGAPSCCQELKDAGQKWLDAVGTAREQDAAAALYREIREDVSSIEHTIEFFESPAAAGIFGSARQNPWRTMPVRSRRKAQNGAIVPPVRPG